MVLKYFGDFYLNIGLNAFLLTTPIKNVKDGKDLAVSSGFHRVGWVIFDCFKKNKKKKNFTNNNIFRG